MRSHLCRAKERTGRNAVAKLGEKLCAKPNQALIGLQMEGGAFKVLLSIE
jgi:hypothetical protein